MHTLGIAALIICSLLLAFAIVCVYIAYTPLPIPNPLNDEER
jgi:hypothetical protein